MTTFFHDEQLVSALPVNRAAYSDRTAWLMAEISRLIYEPLPGEVTVEEYVEELRQAIKEGRHENLLEGLVSKCFETHRKDCSLVERELSNANFELLDTFIEGDTEALLAKMTQQGARPFLVLAFRGTSSKKDLMTDMQATLVAAPGEGKVHKGFLQAFKAVETKLRQALAPYSDMPLYITGHSLGGALAIVATKYLGSDSTGATYTFGAPRVADDAFYKSIKTPIYRVVNASDAVPRLPFGAGFNFTLAAMRWIPVVGYRASEWLRRFQGYTHEGNLVFMNAPENELDDRGYPYKGLQVSKSPSYIVRSQVVVPRLISTGWKSALADHQISEYCAKLYANALRRM
ncbi:lipase family protein [Oleidesulfovibrio sp.]|uniref:lipase family protein n=1 Tax=Oleidesulfovibrio sp. TaxID=2909707 RepID=UPI003A84FDB3